MHNRFDWKEMIYLQLILLRSWKMQYQGKIGLQSKDQGRQMKGENEIENKEEQEEEDEDFVTLIRFSEENPNGRVTALLNWKLLVIELLPEENAVSITLCISILRRDGMWS